MEDLTESDLFSFNKVSYTFVLIAGSIVESRKFILKILKFVNCYGNINSAFLLQEKL